MITKIISTAIPLPIENIDTDQIIPAQFLKAITREGFSDKLFYGWRKNKDFVLNNKKYSGTILVTGYNFGCGSSREHAVWALVDYGFQVVISSFFADIFKNNALNNQLLPVQVSESFLQKILKIIKNNSITKIIIDVKDQKILIPGKKIDENFYINPYKKTCLINGYDDFGYLISVKKEIIKFEKNYEKKHSRFTW
jgi:3-isopropylmalate/(R)-2-methylmalate dehydratase small subunit